MLGDPMEMAIYRFGDATSKKVVTHTPLGWIVDYDGEDIFGFKLVRKLAVCVAILLLVIFLFIQIIRELCCKTVRYVKPKRLIDKDD